LIILKSEYGNLSVRIQTEKTSGKSKDIANLLKFNIQAKIDTITDFNQ
jgi:hypothetical protein